MRSISDTIERLTRNRTRPATFSNATSLLKLERAGKNPGGLNGWYRMPEANEEPPALVVVLHGCTQTAAGYDHGSGWSKLADEYGFAVLFPEQTRQNNPNLCFNWFQTEDMPILLRTECTDDGFKAKSLTGDFAPLKLLQPFHALPAASV